MKNWDLKVLIENLKAESTALKRLLLLTEDEAPPEVTGYFHQMGKQSNDLVTELVKCAEGSLPLTVAIVGDFNAGKSSFINHILQDSSLCPQNVRPTTSIVTMFVYGPEEKISVHSPEKKRRKISRAEYVRRVKEQHKDASHNQTMRFTFELPNNWLKGLELLDTPGFNNPKNCNDGIVTEGIMAESDAFFYLVDIDKGEIPQSESKTLERLKSEAPDSTLLLVISKADKKSPAAIEKIKASFQTKYGTLFNARILTYSTKVDRDDINTRREITTMLTDLREHATAKNRTSLVRAVQHHYDQRLTAGSQIDAVLHIKASEIEGAALLRDERLERVIAGFHEFVQLAWEQFVSELNDACADSLKVKEVADSRIIPIFGNNDGRVVYKREKLLKKFRSARVFHSVEEEINRTLRTLLGDECYVQPSYIDELRDACASAADDSVELLASVGQSFDSVEDAAEHLRNDFEADFESIADSAWTPLQNAIAGNENYIREQYEDQTQAIRNYADEFARSAKSLRRVYQQGMTLFK